jgi:hypothetical protein
MADLITLAEYKIFRGLTGTTEDSKITPIISSVSQLVKTYCGRTFVDFYAADKTEYFSPMWPVNAVQLSESPLVSITSVSERESVTGAYTALAAADYYYDDEVDSLYRVGTDGVGLTDFKQGPGAVKVVYRAGFSTCPADLKLAVINMVTYYLKDEYKVAQSIGATTINNAGSSSQNNSADFPNYIKRVLDLYRI